MHTVPAQRLARSVQQVPIGVPVAALRVAPSPAQGPAKRKSRAGLVVGLVLALAVTAGAIYFAGSGGGAKDRTGIDLQLRGEKTGLIASARALGLLPEGWRAEGKDRLQCSLYIPSKKGPWHAESSLALQGLTFENRQSSCMAEQVSLG